MTLTPLPSPERVMFWTRDIHLERDLPHPVLQLQGLSCERDDRLLFQALDLTLLGGEAVQLRGPNGAGKTTLLRCIAGLHQDYDGRIELAVDWPEGQQLVFVGHRPGIAPLLSAGENLRWYVQMAGLAPQDGWIQAALARVGLPGWDDVPCEQMSAGQQRRVALARLALPVARTPLWLLDEPFTALDDMGMELVTGLLRGHMETGGGVLFATHQPVADVLPGLRTHWLGTAAA